MLPMSKTLKKQVKFPRVLSFVMRVIKRIPRVAWGTAAVFGVFCLGIVVGSISQSGYVSEQASQKQGEKCAQLTDVLNNYQGLSKLFYLQQQDMDIITDTSQWSTNPQELTDAISSYKQKKNEILFQWGRLYELRRKAGLPSDPNLKAE